MTILGCLGWNLAISRGWRARFQGLGWFPRDGGWIPWKPRFGTNQTHPEFSRFRRDRWKFVDSWEKLKAQEGLVSFGWLGILSCIETCKVSAKNRWTECPPTEETYGVAFMQGA